MARSSSGAAGSAAAPPRGQGPGRPGTGKVKLSWWSWPGSAAGQEGSSRLEPAASAHTRGFKGPRKGPPSPQGAVPKFSPLSPHPTLTRSPWLPGRPLSSTLHPESQPGPPPVYLVWPSCHVHLLSLLAGPSPMRSSSFRVPSSPDPTSFPLSSPTQWSRSGLGLGNSSPGSAPCRPHMPTPGGVPNTEANSISLVRHPEEGHLPSHHLKAAGGCSHFTRKNWLQPGAGGHPCNHS